MSGVRDAVAVAVLAVAVRQLPRVHRERYQREFAAELVDVPHAQRVAFSLRILSQSWSLRSALVSAAPDVDATPAAPLLCRWHKHKWSLQRSPEGDGGYYECLRCAKQKDHNSSVVPPTMGGGWV